MADTVPTGGNGRDNNGRFTSGNAFARGNPNHRKAARLRNALLEAVSEEQLTEAAQALLKKALDGDVIAFRELCDRTVGKASQTNLLERIERLEIALEATGNG